MLEVKNVVFAPEGDRKILNDVSIQVPDGKLIVLTGPNGGGKTTLAKVIAGINMPTSGQILLDGEDITALDPTERAKKGIAFAFQQPVRFKGISVRKLLCLAAGRELTEEELGKVLTDVGVQPEQYVDRQVDTKLSGGEIKRIEIASVLLRNAKVMVFDEPEAGIDLWSFASLIKTFEEIRNTLNGSIVIISHQERILRIADEIAVVADGTIKAKGRPDDMMKLLAENNSVTGKCFRQEEMF